MAGEAFEERLGVSRICWSVSSASHRPTRFSQDEPVGKKCRWNRGWAGRYLFVELGQELLELLGPMPAVHRAGHFAGRGLKGCEQHGGAGTHMAVSRSGAGERPVSFAIGRVGQCVAFFGVGSSVLVTTAATCSSVTVLGPPEHGTSPGPAIRYCTNRTRQRPTTCGVERPRTHPSSTARSSSDSVNSAFGRPVRTKQQACTSEQNS